MECKILTQSFSILNWLEDNTRHLESKYAGHRSSERKKKRLKLCKLASLDRCGFSPSRRWLWPPSVQPRDRTGLKTSPNDAMKTSPHWMCSNHDKPTRCGFFLTVCRRGQTTVILCARGEDMLVGLPPYWFVELWIANFGPPTPVLPVNAFIRLWAASRLQEFALRMVPLLHGEQESWERLTGKCFLEVGYAH